MEIRLGTPTDYLDLCSATYMLRLDMPDPGDAPQRAVAGELQITADTPDGLWKARRAVEDMLRRARRAHVERWPAAERVSLQMRLGTAGWTHADVIGGTLDGFEHHATGISTYCALTLTCLPLLRTDAIVAENLLAAPCDPTASAWTATNVTATADDASAPDGSLTAATLRETATTGNHEIRQQATKPAVSAAYTGSAYARADGRGHVALWLSDSTGTNGAYAGFDLTAGAGLYPAGVSGAGFSGATAAITDAGGGWWRVSVTATTNADTGLRLYVQCHDGSGTSYAGNAALGLRVWGMQLAAGDGPGLLLVPTYHADTVWGEHVVPGYEYDAVDYTADPDNLWSGGWTTNNMTETTGQPDVAGGSSAIRYTDNNSLSQPRWIQAATPPAASGLPRTYTFAVYVKNYAGRNTVRLCVTSSSTNPSSIGASRQFDLVTGNSAVNYTSSGYAVVSNESIDCGGGWWWLRLSVSVPSGSTISGYITAQADNFGAYTGNTAYGILVFRPQIVAGEAIDKPINHIVVDDTTVPQATLATGKPSGAYIYGIPGDAPALMRLELADATTGGDAVNRVHVGGWSGRAVRLGALAPFTLLDAAEGAILTTGSASQVGEHVPLVNASPAWQTVGTMPIPADVRGRFDVVARVRDTSSNVSPPELLSVVRAGGIYARQVARVTTVLQGSQTSISLAIPVTTPGATLVLMAQGNSAGTMSITANGGLTWSALHTPSGLWQAGFRAWHVSNAAAISSTLTVGWSAGMTDGTVSLIEIIGAATASLDQTDTDYLDQRNADNLSGTASVTTTQAAELLLSAGLGLGDWSQAFTVPIDGNALWHGVSSLTSGAIYARSVSSTGTYTARWMRMIIDRGGTAQDEAWLVTLASFKAADASGANLTIGRWSVCVTAIDANGVEGMPSQVGAVDVLSTSSSVTATWAEPENGTAASYRVYRNRGTGWAYATVTAPATTHTFTSETGLTSGNPPSSPPAVAAVRLAVALPSGETLWAGRAVSAARSNGLYEDMGLGSAAFPPTVAGEGDTPDGALAAVQVAHQTGAPVGVDGVWLYGAETGQAVVERRGLDETNPLDWIIDTNRDERLAAWLEDAGDEAGQLAQRVPGALVVEPGNALLAIRPQIAGGLSDLPAADLRITRVLITPRWRYLAPGDG